jgi:hypothetical protein
MTAAPTWPWKGPGETLSFYWQQNGAKAWHLEGIPGSAGSDEAPGITTMNHGSGDGVCVLEGLYVFCAVNGTAAWQYHGPHNLFLFAGSGSSITENNGSDNIAIFAEGGDLLFLWDDSNGTYHQELVDPDPT